MLTIGFSTGALAYGDFSHALNILHDTNANAVELSALRSEELPSLLAKLPSMLPGLRKRFKYISFHAPTDFDDEEYIVSQLRAVSDEGLNIIVHPDTIGNRMLWRKLGRSLCIENMDTRKQTGRTVEELAGFFDDLPNAKFCLDIAHARQVDPTMTEAARLIWQFHTRLAQIHISEVDGRGNHFPMSFSARQAFEQFSHVLSRMPVIIEAIVKGGDVVLEIRKTILLLRSSLSKDLPEIATPIRHPLEATG